MHQLTTNCQHGAGSHKTCRIAHPGSTAAIVSKQIVNYLSELTFRAAYNSFSEDLVRNKVSNALVCLCMFAGAAITASAATITYTFEAQVPTNNGPMPGGFVLNVPNFIPGGTAINPTTFTGSDFASCSAPGTGPCFAEFYVGPSPISGLANDIGFGNDVCCFIYFFPDLSFITPGTYAADSFHSAGTATLTVAVSGVPEPGTLGLAVVPLSMALLRLRKRWAGKSQ